jgi:hypothetical protein
MGSNNETVLEMPPIVCPVCRAHLEMSRGEFDKMSKEEYRRFAGDADYDLNFIVTSCSNINYPQYCNFKVIKLKRVKVPTASVDISGIKG